MQFLLVAKEGAICQLGFTTSGTVGNHVVYSNCVRCIYLIGVVYCIL